MGDPHSISNMFALLLECEPQIEEPVQGEKKMMMIVMMINDGSKSEIRSIT